MARISGLFAACVAAVSILILAGCAMPVTLAGYTGEFGEVMTGEGIADMAGANYQVTLEPSGTTCTAAFSSGGGWSGTTNWTCSDGRTGTTTSTPVDAWGQVWRDEGSLSDGTPIVAYGGIDGARVAELLADFRQSQVERGHMTPAAPGQAAPVVSASPYLQLTVALAPRSGTGVKGQTGQGTKEQLRDFLARQFKTVREVDGIQTAGMVGADLIALYDISTSYQMGLADTASADVSVDVMTVDGRLIQNFRGQSRNTGFIADVGAAANDALNQVERAFKSSSAVRVAAEDILAGGGPAQPQPRVASAPRTRAPARPSRSRFPTEPIRVVYPEPTIKPDDIGVIIGNADYGKMGADIPDVVPALADAEGFKRFLTEGKGLRPGNIIDLRDATGAQMIRVFGTATNPRGQLADWVKPGRSRVWVYYAGHGAPAEGSGTPYLVPVDADAARIELNGYPLDVLYRNLAQIRAKSVTVVLEACFSGASEAGAVISNASPVYLKAKTPPVPAGITVIAAGGPNQMASWEEDRSHGLFTKYFLKGMAGEADKPPYGNGDKTVGWKELDGYLKDTVTYYARRYYGRDQTAVIAGGR